MIRAGEMRHRLSIQEQTFVPDAAGQPEEAWALHAEVWGAVEPLLGNEFVASLQRQDRLPTRFRMRFLEGVVPRMRIVFDGRLFDILTVQVPAGIKHEMIVLAEEQVEVPVEGAPE